MGGFSLPDSAADSLQSRPTHWPAALSSAVQSGMKKAAPKSGFSDTLKAISSKQPKQRRKQPKRLQKRLQRQLPQQRKRLQQQRMQLRKRRKRLQQQLLPSYRKRPGPWQRSAKPAGATFSCLCPQKGCQKSGGLGTVFKARDPSDRVTRAEDASQLALLHIQPLIIRCIRLFPIGPRWCTASPRLSVVNRRQNQPAKGSTRTHPWSIGPRLSPNRAFGCPTDRPMDHAR